MGDLSYTNFGGCGADWLHLFKATNEIKNNLESVYIARSIDRRVALVFIGKEAHCLMLSSNKAFSFERKPPNGFQSSRRLLSVSDAVL
ncbi:MAG TPA: hypothetical protein VIK35_09645 [Verrucomicrobiae bacterium]